MVKNLTFSRKCNARGGEEFKEVCAGQPHQTSVSFH